MKIRPITEADYPTLVGWWQRHKATVIPQHILPRGWMIEDGVAIAASFLMVDVGGKFAVIEFLTTNPMVAYSRTLVENVKVLVAYIEDHARAEKCTFIMSFVAPGSGEERMMARIGYTIEEGSRHQIMCKPLGPKGGA